MTTSFGTIPMGAQKEGPSGRMKNCDTWAEYEDVGTSETARLCSGGIFQGERFTECPSRTDCLAATRRLAAAQEERRGGVYTAQGKPFGSTVLASSMVRRDGPRNGGQPYSWEPLPTSIPTNRVQQQATVTGPIAATPPTTNPVSMQTPYVVPATVQPGGSVSPTFLPVGNENAWGRLCKNVAQGWMNSTGWHIFDLSRSIDFFRK